MIKHLLTLLSAKRWLKRALFFSFFYNLLLLVPTWYMMEVYDRVVMSRNLHTLAWITLMAVTLMIALEAIAWVRSEILYQAGRSFQAELQSRVLRWTMQNASRKDIPYNDVAISDVHQLSAFVSSPALLAILDAPFALIFLAVLYMNSLLLGHVVVVVTLLVLALAWLNERAVNPALHTSNQLFRGSQVFLGNIVRNAEVIHAMHIAPALSRLWLTKHLRYVAYQTQASLSAATYQTWSKQLQVMLGSLMMGLGCYLMMIHDTSISGSTLIITSILASRFLSPMVQLITGWKVVANSHAAFVRLEALMQTEPVAVAAIELPKPTGQLSVENVYVKMPQVDAHILKQIHFQLPAGKCLALVGPSGSGKSTLAKLLVGAMAPDSGYVRLDGASMVDWDKTHLGQYIGYLPQEVALYDGSLEENIARFAESIDHERVATLITQVGLQSFVAQLPQGLQTLVGPRGVGLPGGKKQLIGLCRALYSQPSVLVLDEPNSSLDQEGEQGLRAALTYQKTLGTTMVLITHQMAYLQFADLALVLMEGQMRLFGPTQEVAKSLMANQTKSAANPAAGVSATNSASQAAASAADATHPTSNSMPSTREIGPTA